MSDGAAGFVENYRLNGFATCITTFGVGILRIIVPGQYINATGLFFG